MNTWILLLIVLAVFQAQSATSDEYQGHSSPTVVFSSSHPPSSRDQEPGASSHQAVYVHPPQGVHVINPRGNHEGLKYHGDTNRPGVLHSRYIASSYGKDSFLTNHHNQAPQMHNINEESYVRQHEDLRYHPRDSAALYNGHSLDNRDRSHDEKDHRGYYIRPSYAKPEEEHHQIHQNNFPDHTSNFPEVHRQNSYSAAAEDQSASGSSPTVTVVRPPHEGSNENTNDGPQEEFRYHGPPNDHSAIIHTGGPSEESLSQDPLLYPPQKDTHYIHREDVRMHETLNNPLSESHSGMQSTVHFQSPAESSPHAYVNHQLREGVSKEHDRGLRYYSDPNTPSTVVQSELTPYHTINHKPTEESSHRAHFPQPNHVGVSGEIDCEHQKDLKYNGSSSGPLTVSYSDLSSKSQHQTLNENTAHNNFNHPPYGRTYDKNNEGHLKDLAIKDSSSSLSAVSIKDHFTKIHSGQAINHGNYQSGQTSQSYEGRDKETYDFKDYGIVSTPPIFIGNGNRVDTPVLKESHQFHGKINENVQSRDYGDSRHFDPPNGYPTTLTNGYLSVSSDANVPHNNNHQPIKVHQLHQESHENRQEKIPQNFMYQRLNTSPIIQKDRYTTDHQLHQESHENRQDKIPENVMYQRLNTNPVTQKDRYTKVHQLHQESHENKQEEIPEHFIYHRQNTSPIVQKDRYTTVHQLRQESHDNKQEEIPENVMYHRQNTTPIIQKDRYTTVHQLHQNSQENRQEEIPENVMYHRQNSSPIVQKDRYTTPSLNSKGIETLTNNQDYSKYQPKERFGDQLSHEHSWDGEKNKVFTRHILDGKPSGDFNTNPAQSHIIGNQEESDSYDKSRSKYLQQVNNNGQDRSSIGEKPRSTTEHNGFVPYNGPYTRPQVIHISTSYGKNEIATATVKPFGTPSRAQAPLGYQHSSVNEPVPNTEPNTKQAHENVLQSNLKGLLQREAYDLEHRGLLEKYNRVSPHTSYHSSTGTQNDWLQGQHLNSTQLFSNTGTPEELLGGIQRDGHSDFDTSQSQIHVTIKEDPARAFYNVPHAPIRHNQGYNHEVLQNDTNSNNLSKFPNNISYSYDGEYGRQHQSDNIGYNLHSSHNPIHKVSFQSQNTVPPVVYARRNVSKFENDLHVDKYVTLPEYKNGAGYIDRHPSSGYPENTGNYEELPVHGSSAIRRIFNYGPNITAATHSNVVTKPLTFESDRFDQRRQEFPGSVENTETQQQYGSWYHNNGSFTNEQVQHNRQLINNPLVSPVRGDTFDTRGHAQTTSGHQEGSGQPQSPSGHNIQLTNNPLVSPVRVDTFDTTGYVQTTSGHQEGIGQPQSPSGHNRQLTNNPLVSPVRVDTFDTRGHAQTTSGHQEGSGQPQSPSGHNRQLTNNPLVSPVRVDTFDTTGHVQTTSGHQEGRGQPQSPSGHQLRPGTHHEYALQFSFNKPNPVSYNVHSRVNSTKSEHFSPAPPPQYMVHQGSSGLGEHLPIQPMEHFNNQIGYAPQMPYHPVPIVKPTLVQSGYQADTHEISHSQNDHLHVHHSSQSGYHYGILN